RGVVGFIVERRPPRFANTAWKRGAGSVVQTFDEDVASVCEMQDQLPNGIAAWVKLLDRGGRGHSVERFFDGRAVPRGTKVDLIQKGDHSGKGEGPHEATRFASFQRRCHGLTGSTPGN